MARISPEPPRRPAHLVERVRVRFLLVAEERRCFVDELGPGSPHPDVGWLWEFLRTRTCRVPDDFVGGLVFEGDGAVWAAKTWDYLDYVESWIDALRRLEAGTAHVGVAIYGRRFQLTRSGDLVILSMPPPWPPPRKRSSQQFASWSAEYELWGHNSPPPLAVRRSELLAEAQKQLHAYARVVAGLLRQTAFDRERRRGIEAHMWTWCMSLLVQTPDGAELCAQLGLPASSVR